MARAATTSDIFNAVAEPRRREIIDLLSTDDEKCVRDLVKAMRLPQPTVSKHLRVLRAVRVVSMNRRGRHRVYRLNAKELKPVHQWVKYYEQFWTNALDRIKQRAEAEQRKSQISKN